MLAGNKQLLIRADGDAAIGFGHVMRCLALAQYWRDQMGDVHWLSCRLDSTLQKRIENERFQLTMIDQTPGSLADAAETRNRSSAVVAVVLDGYRFGDQYQAGLCSDRCLLVFDDDQHARHQQADLILNQNLGAQHLDYSGTLAGCLLGLDYCLFRDDLLEHVGSSRQVAEAGKRVLITLGGADPDDVVWELLLELRDVALRGHWQVRVILGAAYRKRQDWQRWETDWPDLQVYQNVTQMASHYQWADLAICAGGSSNWELSLFGVPRLVLPIAANQVPAAKEMQATGTAVVIPVGDWESLRRETKALLLSPARRNEMMVRSRRLVDGNGRQRVANEIWNVVVRKSNGSEAF